MTESPAPPLKERARELDLDAIRARCEAATSGPWGADQLASGVRHLERNCSDWYFSGLPENYNLPGRQGDGGTRDGEFIAHARTDIPELLDALISANARVAELEGDAGAIRAETLRMLDTREAHRP